MFAGHDGAAEVNGGYAVKCSLGDFIERRIPASDAHADIIMKDVDAAPTPSRGLDHRRECRLLGNVGFEGDAFPTRLSRHRDRFLGGRKIVVDGQHLGGFLSETQNRSATIAQALAW